MIKLHFQGDNNEIYVERSNILAINVGSHGHTKIRGLSGLVFFVAETIPQVLALIAKDKFVTLKCVDNGETITLRKDRIECIEVRDGKVFVEGFQIDMSYDEAILLVFGEQV